MSNLMMTLESRIFVTISTIYVSAKTAKMLDKTPFSQ